MQRGFTLVELSVAIVIIGLLTGGILVAQSLIKSAEISAQVRQIQQIQIAVQNFKSAYRSLPGDSNKIGDTGSATTGQPAKICAGNNDGRIANNITSTSTGDTSWSGGSTMSCDADRIEHLRVFEHLGVTGMYDWDQFDDGDWDNFTAGIAYPEQILDSYSPPCFLLRSFQYFIDI